MKILFITLPSKSWDAKPDINLFPHIGVAYLSAYLKQSGRHIPSVVDLSLNWKSWENVLKQAIEKNNPDCIGITIYTHLVPYASNIIAWLKINTTLPIIIGGPHVSITGKEVLQEFFADYAIRMDGEIALLKLLDGLEKGCINSVPNLIYKDKGNIVVNDYIELVDNLNELPIPDYSIFDCEKYLTWTDKTYMILTSRGCPYSCTYCSAPLVTGKKFRARSPENILKELTLAKKQGFKHFGVTDDAFNVDEQRSIAICQMLIDNKLNMTWDTYNGLRANTTSPELFKAMKQSGCKFVGFGLEAGTNEMLVKIKKGLTIERVQQAVKECKEAGLGCSVNIIIGHPDETWESAKESLRIAKSLECSYVNILGLIPMPGTVAYNQLQEMVKNKKATFFHSPSYYISEITAQSDIPIFDTQTFSAELRTTILKEGRKISEYTVIRYRFGCLGILVYWLTRNRKLFMILNNLRKTVLGKIYNRIRRGK